MDLRKALNICHACLSSDRQLYPLSKCPSLIQLSFLQATATVCWECSNEVLRFCKFIKKAITAQRKLADVQHTDDILCLSTLAFSNHQPLFEFKYIDDPLTLEFDEATSIKEEVCSSDTETASEQTDNAEEDIEDNLEENLIKNENVDKKMFESQTNINVHIKTEIDEDKKKITYNKKIKTLLDIDNKLSEVSEEVMKKILVTELTHEEVLKRRDQQRRRHKYQNSLYKCDFCILGFKNKENLNEHIKMKHSHIDYNNVNKPGELTDCDVCKMRFKSPIVAQSHHERHYMHYKCRLCEYEACALHVIVAHCEDKHERKTVERTPVTLTCDFCSKVLSTPEEYLEHLNTEHRTCELCGYKVKRKGSIRYHMSQMHSQKGNLICDHCQKTFKSRYKFELHISTHGEGIAKKMSHCNICNEQFKNVRDYRTHLRTSVNHVKGMAYKWCVVPQCTNTSIKSPQKMFVSVPTNPKTRKKWLQLARRDPKSIASQSNVFMCEDHFDMEKDIINYMKYKMGFSQKIVLAYEAVPTKFHCQDEDRKRRLSDAGSSREVFLKKQRIDLVTECLQSQSATKTHAESLQKDYDTIQVIIEPEESGI